MNELEEQLAEKVKYVCETARVGEHKSLRKSSHDDCTEQEEGIR